MSENKELTLRQQKLRKALTWVGNILGIIIVIFTLLVSIVTITRTKERDGVASMFGYALMPVLSNSMAPEFEEGDLIFTKIYKGDGTDLKVGDVITYKFYLPGGKAAYNTHRIVAIAGNDSNSPGAIRFYTKGDNERIEGQYTDEVGISSIVGVYKGSKIKGIGSAINTLQTDSTVYFVSIVLPLIVIFIIYVFFFVRAVIQIKLDKAAAANASKNIESLSEEELSRLLEEIQRKKQLSDIKPQDEPQKNDGEISD